MILGSRVIFGPPHTADRKFLSASILLIDPDDEAVIDEPTRIGENAFGQALLDLWDREKIDVGRDADPRPAFTSSPTMTMAITEQRLQAMTPDRARGRLWAQRLKRVFDIDVSISQKCGGETRVIAGIEDQAVIDKILVHLIKKGASPPPPELLPAARA